VDGHAGLIVATFPVSLIKAALLICDNRDEFRQYESETPWFGTAPEALLQGFAQMPGEVEIHVVTCTHRPMKSPEKLAGNIFFHSLLVPKLGWLRTGYQGCVSAIRRRLREIGPDIVHGQGTERFAGISAVRSGFPNVLTVHGNMRLVAKFHRARPFSFLWLTARLESFTLPRTDGVVCITTYTREAVDALARKTWVVPNAVDASFFEIERAPSEKRRILCVATIDERKNQNALIDAIDTLERPANLEIVFLGGANRENPYVRDFFRRVETRPWCRYAGFADRAALRDTFATASGLVLPSLEDNCPMAVLEAMAAGAPVAAARVGGVPDLVRDGENGWLFDPHDLRSIAGAMQKLIDDPDPGRAARARAEARERFHPRTIAARHLEIYRQVIAKSLR
jgi:glycosyltransferase involved in cell wall biosynthesis